MTDTATNEQLAVATPQKNQLDERGLLRYGKMLIDGQWVDAVSGQTFAAIYPGTGATIANVASGDSADVALAAQAARRAFDSGPWPKMNGSERAKLLWKVPAG